MSVIDGVLFGLAALAVAATILPFWRVGYWWVRACDFPRAQIAVLLAVALLGLIVRNEWDGPAISAGLAVAISLAYQLYRIFPYTTLSPLQTPTAEADDVVGMRVVACNVLQQNKDADAVIRVVRDADPDVIAFLETDDWWTERLSGFDADYPHRVKQPLDNMYGLILYSRIPLIDPELRFLVEEDIPSVRAEVELDDGFRVAIYAIHPRPPTPEQDAEERDAELLMVGKEIKQRDMPAIVFGDMNDVAWSDTSQLFQRISGCLDPRRGRGFYSTFHARYPILRWPLDHVFHTDHFSVKRIARLPYNGSDHFAFLAELRHVVHAHERGEGPQADADDKQEAREKIEEGLEEARTD
jgi:endonuclease/exonuclease/phosphatase (EEP) superfamily protein YafD